MLIVSLKITFTFIFSFLNGFGYNFRHSKPLFKYKIRQSKIHTIASFQVQQLTSYLRHISY
uniref:Uncharacterized protein n=1 Tax=Arundo donax TaxID=35708 RepID=A0A0A9BF29_ARUDO